jgi:two-component system LytT family response regulator
MTDPAAFEPIATLVVDDEREAREGMLDLLRRDPELRVIAVAGTGREAVDAIRHRSPELVLLDIQMPELDGFGVLRAVSPRELPVVVFVTAYDEYALRAFEAHALDYLLKPFADDRFLRAVAHAKAQVRQRRLGALGRDLASAVQRGGLRSRSGEGRADRIMARAGEETAVLRVEDIDWIEARNYCVKLHVGGREYLLRETMTRIGARLDPDKFVRIHRSSIINLDRLESLQPFFRGGYIVRLRDGTRLQLSRSRKAAFERAIGQNLGQPR